MLPTFQSNTQGRVVIDYPVIDGTQIAPTSATYVVTDEVGSIVIPETIYPLGPDPVVRIEVSPEDNIVPEGRTRAMRVVSVTFQAPTGQHQAASRYVIETPSLLITMRNSFQTYDESLLTRLELPALDGWDMASDQERVAAMVTSHDRMCRLTYRYRLSQDAVAYDVHDPYWHVTDMRLRTMADYERWPEQFKRALHRAQVFESDQILKGDPVGDKRRSGIFSETIGESKMFFNPRPPLRLALCVQAMETLSPYLHSARRIARA